MELKVKKVRENATLPTYGSDGAAASDLYACIEENITIAPGETVFVPTGLSMAIPKGYGGFIYARSGLSCKQGLAPANKVGIVDADYRGEVMVALHNHSKEERTIEPQERIAQFDNKLYLEFGGKLFDDTHASRVLPGFEPDSKLKMLLMVS